MRSMQKDNLPDERESLALVFRYVVECEESLDNALFPPFNVIRELNSLLNKNGLDAFQVEDSLTLLEMLQGLRMLGAEVVPGYYDESHYESAIRYANKLLAQKRESYGP